jgi:hypothetical protein
MLVTDIQVVDGPDYCELQARLKFDAYWVWGDEPFLLWYRYPVEYRDCLRVDNGDPFLAVGLAPAMLLGETLEISVPVSPRILDSVPEIQSIYHCWEPRLQEIDVKAPRRDAALPLARPQPFTGLFLSLGVDSCYSLHKNVTRHPADVDAVTHLISVLGFDVYLWESERYPPILAGAQRVARELKKTVLPVCTNLRDLGDRLVDWPLIHHGAGLASVVLAVAPAFRRALIAASHSYAELHINGTHPLLDPLWSTENVLFVHDGCEANRLEKIRTIAQSQLLLDTVRVCIADDAPSTYNCGRCEKCLRTMLGLWIAGALEKSAAFPHEIDPDRLRHLEVAYRDQLIYWRELRDALGVSPKERAIKDSLDEAFASFELGAGHLLP